MVRLTEAISHYILQTAVQQMLLQTLVYENANTDYQKVFWPIQAAGGNLNDCIKTCADIGSETYKPIY